jgi:hypothetical protein
LFERASEVLTSLVLEFGILNIVNDTHNVG